MASSKPITHSLSDSGYCSESNLEALIAHGIDGHFAPRTRQAPDSGERKGRWTVDRRMRKKIDDGGFETRYRLKKQVLEPVFGQIK